MIGLSMRIKPFYSILLLGVFSLNALSDAGSPLNSRALRTGEKQAIIEPTGTSRSRPKLQRTYVRNADDTPADYMNSNSISGNTKYVVISRSRAKPRNSIQKVPGSQRSKPNSIVRYVMPRDNKVKRNTEYSTPIEEPFSESTETSQLVGVTDGRADIGIL